MKPTPTVNGRKLAAMERTGGRHDSQFDDDDVNGHCVRESIQTEADVYNKRNRRADVLPKI